MAQTKEIFSKQGKFWLSGYSEASAAIGILSVAADGTTQISLGQGFNSLFIDHDTRDSFMFESHKLFGTLENGQSVFCPEAYIRNSSLTLRGNLPNSFRAQSCIIVDEFIFNENSDAKIESVRFPLKQLLAWFRPTMPSMEGIGENQKLVLPPQLKELFEIQIGSILIENEILNHHDFQKREVEIKYLGYLVFTPKQGFSISEVIDFTKSIEDFLMLFTDQTVGLDWPTLQFSSGVQRAEFYFTRMEMPSKDFSFHECWLEYRQVQPNFRSLLEAWFSMKNLFGPAFYLYAGNRRSRSLYDEHRFMNCITGFESFHYKTERRIQKNIKLEQKIVRLMDSLSPNITRSDRRWAEQKGKQCLEPSLADRIQDLINSLPIEFDKKGVNTFSLRCAELRNDISHYGGPRSSDKDYREFVREIHIKYRALEILYHALLLSQIGVASELISSAMKTSFVGGRIKYELQAAGLSFSFSTMPSTIPAT